MTKEVTCLLCNTTGKSPNVSFEATIFPCNTREYWSRDILKQSRLCFRTQNGIITPPMKFELKHISLRGISTFTELDAPTWLTSEDTFPGSTMDGRWFWEEHVLTLEVGQSTKTDFNIITRVE